MTPDEIRDRLHEAEARRTEITVRLLEAEWKKVEMVDRLRELDRQRRCSPPY